jgi:omega-amidase
MRLRLVELPINGSPEECMERSCGAACTSPVPDLALLPELFSTGFVMDRVASLSHSPEDLPGLLPAKVSASRSMWFAAGTLPVRRGGGIVNRMAVYSRTGELAYTTEKVHLFRQMGEDTIFLHGSSGGTFDLEGTRTAGIVCYDLRFPELSRRLTMDGAELILVPAQWPSGRITLFRSLLRARAAESQIFMAGCNLGGEHLGVSFMGGGGVAHPSGSLLKGIDIAEGVSDYILEPGDVADMRLKIDCLSDRRPEEYHS